MKATCAQDCFGMDLDLCVVLSRSLVSKVSPTTCSRWIGVLERHGARVRVAFERSSSRDDPFKKPTLSQ